MKEKIVLLIKGFIMGIANIIPGVSGGTLAMTLGIYEQFISSISHFLKSLKENLNFLIPVLFGIGISLLTMSRVIDYSYVHFPLPTTFFFVGLVLGGIPMIYHKVEDVKQVKLSNMIIFFGTCSLVMLMSAAGAIFPSLGNVNLESLNFLGYILLFLIGIIAASTMVIPGISGSLMLMLLGYYYPIIELVKSITKLENLGHNLIVAVVFGFGVIVGFVAISKLIEFLFSKYEKKFYFGVLGFILASAPAILISAYQEISFIVDIPQILASIVLFFVGCVISYKLGER